MANEKKFITCDGNYAASNIAYLFCEHAAIYPITPSSTMAENIDEWAAHGKKNLWGETVKVTEMQSGPAPPAPSTVPSRLVPSLPRSRHPRAFS